MIIYSKVKASLSELSEKANEMEVDNPPPAAEVDASNALDLSESEEEEEEPQLSMAGKDMRKLVKKLEKNLAYDESDDDKNPYASSVSYHRWMLNSSSLT